MSKRTDKGSGLLPVLCDQRGITGLETAIVLIAFVVVASVFAFAVLTTGLLSSEKSKEAILGAVEETESTILKRGSVVALGATSSVTHLKFEVGQATQGGEPIEFSSSDVVVTYVDPYQAVNLSFTADPDNNAGWGSEWLAGGSGPVLDPGERVGLDLNLTALATPLATSTEFTVEVKPTTGAVLSIQRKTPAELSGAMDLH